MTDWKYHTPQRDGHAPDYWVEGLYAEYENDGWWTATNPTWFEGVLYRYRPLQDATPDLLAQCLALPQDQREALIEAMQKPQRDWADDVWFEAFWAWDPMKADGKKAAAVIRSMCRPKEELQHVAYYDEGKFHWMSGIAPRDCELFAKREALS